MTSEVGRGRPPKHAQFKKGDPRINRKGRPPFPKDRKQLAEYIRAWLEEPTSKNKVRLDKLLQRMEKHGTGQRVLLEYSWGKVPQPVDVTTGGEPLKVIIEHRDDHASDPAPGPEADQG